MVEWSWGPFHVGEVRASSGALGASTFGAWMFTMVLLSTVLGSRRERGCRQPRLALLSAVTIGITTVASVVTWLLLALRLSEGNALLTFVAAVAAVAMLPFEADEAWAAGAFIWGRRRRGPPDGRCAWRITIGKGPATSRVQRAWLSDSG